jgi:hypothetical protein
LRPAYVGGWRQEYRSAPRQGQRLLIPVNVPLKRPTRSNVIRDQEDGPGDKEIGPTVCQPPQWQRLRGQGGKIDGKGSGHFGETKTGR